MTDMRRWYWVSLSLQNRHRSE